MDEEVKKVYDHVAKTLTGQGPKLNDLHGKTIRTMLGGALSEQLSPAMKELLQRLKELEEKR